jgi:predicted AAA+ superfamily ATPase
MDRYIYKVIIELALQRNKMAFVTGPRQVGKTTLSKSYQKNFDQFIYKNWDESKFRKMWTISPNSIQEEFSLAKEKESKLVVFDEIHKSKSWKQKIKGIYDEFNEDFNIIVTGSARLNIFKKGGDSLMGRYLNFRLHPLTYGEVTSSKELSPEQWKISLFQKSNKTYAQAPLLKLIKLSGFPEPFFANSEKILRIWRKGRNEKIVREDLRDLSRLPELSQVEMLTSLLPMKVGSPLSVQSLREDLEVAHDTVSRWLRYLNELFYFFEIKPWTKSVPRSLKKEGKIYLYDWTEIEDVGPRFENLVACHLIKACHFWTDTGEGDFDLFYLRNKEKQEIDFVIIKDKKPWLCFEVKVSDTTIDHKVTNKFLGHLKCPYIQIVQTEGIWRADGEKLVVSAARAFAGLP